MFKKMKENKKKGFTLVELIVVLVILAILAALLIPALTGYIDRAKKKSIIAETRQVVMAAQTIVDEAYAKDSANATMDITTDDAKKQIYELADIATPDDSNGITVATVAKGKITTLTYVKGGMTCTYTPDGKGDDGKYSVDE